MAESMNRRDIDMIFRAETDSATRSVGELKKSVGGLRQELKKQIELAERGEGSLDDLAATTRKLKQAQDELGTARSLLTQLNTLAGNTEKAEKRVGKLGDELGKLRAQQAAAEKPTKTLTNAVERKEKALAAANEKLEKERQTLAAYKREVEGVVGPVDRLEDSFREVAKITKDVAGGLAIAGKGADEFAAKSRQAASAAADLDDFRAFAGKAGMLEDDIAYLAQFEDRIERVTAARNAQIAADLRFQDSLEQTQLAQQRLAQTEAFQKIAAEARASVNDVGRFKAETVETEASINRLANAVADLADPARSAANDLAQVSQTVDRVAADIAKGGNRRTGALSQDLNDIEQALAALQRQAGQIDGLRAQQAAVDATSAEWRRAKQDVLDFAGAIDAAGANATDEMVASLRQAEASAEKAGTAFKRQSTELSRLEKAAEAASIDIYNLDRAEKQIIGTSTSAGNSAEFLRRKLGGGAKGGGFLGLQPYEIQNLGFQINDIFVSLASGQKPLTVLVQQGSQIAQLFPGVWGALAAGLPILGPLVALLAAFALGTARAAENAQRAREIGAALVQMGSASKATAEEIEASISRLDDLGAGAEEAKKAILSLVKEGMDPAFFDDFSAAALAFSEITGTDLPEATERLAEGLTRGKDEVLALDDEFKFLSESEREQIRAMDDSTDAAEIRTIAFDAFHRQAIAVADELRGPSKDAVETLESAWSDFLDTLADVAGFEGVDDWLAKLTDGIAVFIRFLSNAIKQVKDSFGQLADAYDKGGVMGALRAVNGISTGEKSASELLDQSTRELAGERSARNRNRRTRTSSGDVGRGTRGARSTREGIKPKRERKKKTGKSDAEKLAEQLEREQEQLLRALEQMSAKALSFQQQSIEDQLAGAAQTIELEYAKLYRQLDEFGKKFGPNATINGMSQADYRAQLDANKKIIVQRSQLKVYEESINDLLDERTRRLKQIEERYNAGLISASDALLQAKEVTSALNPAIEKAAGSARNFATALAGANPSPELKAFIAKLDGVSVTLTETGSDLAAMNLRVLNDIESERNKIIARRDALVQANNELVDLGLKTRRQAQADVEAGFNREAAGLLNLIAKEREYIALLLQEGAITQTDYDARMAQLAALAQQTEYVSAEYVQMKSAIDQAITQEAVTFFSSMAEAMAGAVVGAHSVTDALESIGLAFLNMIANVLRMVAELILQMMILNAVEKVTGIPVKALLGAMNGGGGGGGVLGFLGSFFHGGGTAGQGSSRMSRSNFSVSPAMIAAAPRYHEGTAGAGLKRNEMVAVLEKGEKVLTEEQQRLEAKADARAGQGGGKKLRQVLAFGDEEIAGAMASPAGEEVTVTHIRRNRTQIRQELGID